ncbi:MAG: hypothetical protein KAX44_00745 [Candidatus Brocadiae bacterium]|nr:hypothetical protein [Candidatus Brocadiia bacterium]
MNPQPTAAVFFIRRRQLDKWHCGNAPLCLAADPHKTALRSRSDMTGEEPIPELWVRVPDHDRLYRALVEEGFIHHASMIHGDQRVPLRRACEFLDIRPIVVD